MVPTALNQDSVLLGYVYYPGVGRRRREPRRRHCTAIGERSTLLTTVRGYPVDEKHEYEQANDQWYEQANEQLMLVLQ